MSRRGDQAAADFALEPPIINLHRDPLAPHRHASYEAEPGRPLIDWLLEFYPDGFGAPLVIHRNGRRIDLADADFAMAPGDVIHLLVQPGDPATAALLTYMVVSAAISAVLSIGLALIMGKPKGPKAHDQQAADPVYSITSAQNAARIGEPVPVLYGRMVTVPDYAAQPYSFFEGNEQYLDLILAIGQGIYTLHDIQVGETPVSALESNAVQYWLIGPEDHAQTMGNIRALTGIMENVVSSPEVADQELSGAPIGDTEKVIGDFRYTAPNRIEYATLAPPAGFARFQVTGTKHNDGYYTLESFTPGSPGIITAVEDTIVNEDPSDDTTITWFHSDEQLQVGPFITSKPGTRGDQILIDLVWPAGLHTIDKDNGDFLNASVNFNGEYQAMDDSGAPIGSYTVVPYTVTARTNTPQRRTFVIDVPAGRYRVLIRRMTPTPPNTYTTNNFVWTGLKFRLLDSAGPVYGPISLLAVRIRATNGIAGAASSRIRAEVTRWLPPLGSGPLAPTRSPADAFIDIYCNQIYGGRRPLSEIDLAEIARLSDHWAGAAKFDAGFVQKSTVWEAMTLSLQTAGAAPLPIGQVMSASQDGVHAIRTQLFSDANMVRGSLSIGYTFDRPGDNDGVEVEYRDPETFNSIFIRYPPEALDPDKIPLFGCTDAAQAAAWARLLWNKQKRLRRTAAFDTELEGLLARRGDRVGIATQLPRWGAAGIVIAVAGLDLLLDQDPDWSGSGHFVILRGERGEPSDPISVSPGPRPNQIRLGSAPPFPLFGTGDQEPTHYAFGNAIEMLRDFTITQIDPRGGNKIGIEAVIYDPAIYEDTLPWMEVPI